MQYVYIFNSKSNVQEVNTEIYLAIEWNNKKTDDKKTQNKSNRVNSLKEGGI